VRAVLYAHDLEPITVVDISASLWQMLIKGQAVRLPVRENLRLGPPDFTYSCPGTFQMKTVDIYGIPIHVRDSRGLMLFTYNEEHAMLLKSELLPGQHKDVQERVRRREDAAFARGFLTALSNFG